MGNVTSPRIARGGAARASSEEEGFPQVFGKYVLLRSMAKGGMGELFLAASGETGGFEKLCVVKKVLQSLHDAGVRRRFLDEAKVVVRLNHANLVQVFDAGRVRDDHFLSMELVEGKDLRAIWNRCAKLQRRIPVDFAIHVIREVARGLDYVHHAMGLDLVHRDISPPNILVGYHGEVKITDFGLAKSAIKREMTSPGVVFGRYSYLSPEQARGLPADARTDIYAAGIVLWELLTGRQLFPSNDRSHQEALASVRHPKVQPPSQVVPGVPPGLDDVVLKALAADRDQRYQTAGELRAALSEVLLRHFPACDTDSVAALMSELFEQERKAEAEDYARFARQDFSYIRKLPQETDAISVSDVILLETPSERSSRSTSSIELAEGDIVELERQDRRGSPVVLDAKALRDSARERVGEIIAQRYRLDALVRVGGMGAVFRATHMALGRQFAVKLLHRMYTRDSDIVTRFMREARAATQTGHPNIVDVVDVGSTQDGEIYVAMELLEGEDFAAVIHREGPLAVRRVIHIVRQICRALAAAHDAGIIHRDLKSENVFLTTRGKDPDFVKVLDFGICKELDAKGDTTTPGLVMGSPDYMAPEQAAGVEASITSDVYSVGCIIFESLTGRMPYVGRNTIDVLMQKGSKDAPKVTSIRPEIPLALSEVVARCLSRRPADRPASLRVLEYELTRAIDGRASAVAAVLGMDLPSDPEPGGEPTRAGAASSSASHSRSAVWPDDGAPVGALSDSISASHPMMAAALEADDELAAPPNRWSRAFGASLLVLLGAGLSMVGLYAVSPATFARVIGAAPVSSSADAPLPAGPQLPNRPNGPNGPNQEPGLASPPPSSTPKAAPSSVTPQTPGAAAASEVRTDPKTRSKATQAAAIVQRAEAALKGAKWRDPPEGSLVLELANLSALDPGHEAITRLRAEAGSILRPRAEKAQKAKQWAEAVDAYRNLLAVVSDDVLARTAFAEVLVKRAEERLQQKDREGALETAAELLNVDPKHFDGMVLRARALGRLGRWGEAREQYKAAKKLRPRNKTAKKGYAYAAKMAKRAT